MLYYPRWKIVLVVVVCVLGILGTLPNFLGSSTLERLPDWVPARTLNLGLDLQGGSHLLLEVDVDAVFRERLESVVDETRVVLRNERIGYRGLGVDGDAATLTLVDPAEADRALALLRETHGGTFVDAGPGAGMDLFSAFTGTTVQEFAVSHLGDGRIEVRLTEEGKEARRAAAVAQSLEVVRRRIDELGTREPNIQRQGDDRILVQVPGERDPERIKELIGQTARLTFHMVDMSVTADEARRGQLPAGSMILPSDERTGDGTPIEYVVRQRVELSGENLVDAQATFQDNQPVVSFRFDSQGARIFGSITRENVGNLFAIVLDNEIISAPRIREPILGGSGVISGNFTTESANDLAILLRAGALPAALEVLEERSVGPDLGADSIQAGQIAGIVALSLVVVFMVAYYGLFGIAANVALFANLFLIMAVLSALGATLTLPGIAGIVLTIGMAVDANVLIFERIREEVRLGKTPFAAVDTGFRQAIRAIVDANVTTLIAALFLFEFGSGPVKGFAVTLAIGVVCSMFTALMLTRLLIVLYLRRMRPKLLPI
jgi:preprotein translocase subunit SecD